MPPAASSARRALAALGLLSLIWGYNWIMLKEGLQFADPFDFAALRTAPGALLLFAAMA
jgi:drug/metabolite transporter (DMT)-like permease